MESQLQNPEFRNNSENLHPCSMESMNPLSFIRKGEGPLTIWIQGNFSCFFFKINFFEKLSECQTDWIQIRPDPKGQA